MLLKLKGIIAKSWFFDILFFVDAGFHGYVLNVSNIRCSLSKVKCFKVVLHDGSNETALILYNSSLHGISESALNTGKIVKISDFKSKDDQFSDEKVVTFGDKPSIEYSKKQISFDRKK